MTFRRLLVHLDDLESCAVRVDLALRLARQFEAELAGLVVVGAPPGAGDIGPGMLGLDAVTAALATMRQAADARGRRFEAQCRARGLRGCQVHTGALDDGSSVVAVSPACDLVVLGQPDPALSGHGAARAAMEYVVLHSPRPTLVVPYIGPAEGLGEAVLAAWDGSRESARALADALPLLRKARRVELVQCQPPQSAEAGAQRRTQLDQMRAWLQAHGVHAVAHLHTTEHDPGNALLSRAADLGADLIVMGAYGRARWAERLLGGTTRTVLAHMTVPVLLSH